MKSIAILILAAIYNLYYSFSNNNSEAAAAVYLRSKRDDGYEWRRVCRDFTT